MQTGNPAAGLPYLRESLAIRAKRADPRDLMYSFSVWSDLALACRQPEIGIQLYAAGFAQVARTGAVPPMEPDDLAQARTQIGEAAFVRLWELGISLSTSEAVALTFQVVPVPAGPVATAAVTAPPPILPFGQTLTKREIDVLRLVAAGKSNAQIGDSLFISPFTAKTHVANLLGKIGVETRAAAATWAAQHHVLEGTG